MIEQLPTINFGLRDRSDSTATLSLRTPAGTEALAAVSAANAVRPAIAALTDAVIFRETIVYRSVEVPRPDASEGSEAPRAGVFVFSCSEPDTFAVVQVPSIRTDLLVTTGPGAGVQIDQAAPDVVSFVDLLIAGDYCNPFAIQLDSLVAAYLQIRP